GALLDFRDAGGDPDDHARARQKRHSRVHLLNEVAKHLLGDIEVAYHAVAERTDRDDRRGRPPDHALGLSSDREHRAGPGVLRDDGGLADDDPAPTNVDEGVGRAEIDTDITRDQAEYGI